VSATSASNSMSAASGYATTASAHATAAQGSADETQQHAANAAALAAEINLPHVLSRTQPRASKITAAALTGIKRVLYGGTSIANNTNAGGRAALGMLQNKFGDGGNKTFHLGVIGGSYEAAFNGWKKQPYSGFGFVRSRGESTSTAIPLLAYMRRAVLRYSRELNGGSFDVLLNGAIYASVNCNGAQSFGNELVIDCGSLAMHTITLHAPASGYAYIETIDYLTDEPGIMLMDASLGGSTLSRLFVPATATGPMAAPIATVGNNGIDALFNNVSANFRPELAVVTWTVNDAGRGMGEFNTYYKPAMDRLVQKTYENNVQLLIVVEMGGHYSMAANANHATFAAIRSLLLDYPKNYPHVTVLDWHGKSGMDTTDQAEVARLGYRYYPAVSAINTVAATYAGDFIHPGNEANELWLEMMTQALGLQPQGAGSVYLSNKFGSGGPSAGVNAGFPLYNKHFLTATPARLERANNIGELRSYQQIGRSFGMLAEAMEALWASEDEINFAKSDFDTLVSAAGTSDAYGSFLVCASTTLSMETPPEQLNTSAVYTCTALIGPGYSVFEPRNGQNTAPLAFSAKGQNLGVGSPSVVVFENTTSRPMYVHFSFLRAPISASDGAKFKVTGKVYDLWITPTSHAVITQRKRRSARWLTAQMAMVGDLASDKVTVGQTYYESINGKVVEKIAIDRNVHKPMSNSMHGLYRLQNRSAANVYRMEPNGTVTVGAFDERVGAPLRTSASNPTFVEGSGLTVAAAIAGHVMTITGSEVDANTRFSVQLYSGSNNNYLGLQADGTWLNHGSSSTAAPPLNPNRSSAGAPIAFTFTLPDVALLDGRNWGLRLYRPGRPAGDPWAYWTAAEGSSPCV